MLDSPQVARAETAQITEDLFPVFRGRDRVD